MTTVTAVTLVADGRSRYHGVRHPAGAAVQVFEVDGFSFPTEDAAEAFAAAEWPRGLPDGRLVTSDRVVFPASKADKARARQARLEEGAA